MEISLIKRYASRFGISEINGGDEQIIMKFDPESTPDLQNAVALMNEMPKKMFMSNPNNPRLHYRIQKPQVKEEPKYLKEVRGLLEKLCPNNEPNSEQTSEKVKKL